MKAVLAGSEGKHVFTDVLGEGVKVVGTRRHILVHRQRGDAVVARLVFEAVRGDGARVNDALDAEGDARGRDVGARGAVVDEYLLAGVMCGAGVGAEMDDRVRSGEGAVDAAGIREVR